MPAAPNPLGAQAEWLFRIGLDLLLWTVAGLLAWRILRPGRGGGDAP